MATEVDLASSLSELDAAKSLSVPSNRLPRKQTANSLKNEAAKEFGIDIPPIPDDLEGWLNLGLEAAATYFGPLLLTAIGVGSVIPGIGNIVGALGALVGYALSQLAQEIIPDAWQAKGFPSEVAWHCPINPESTPMMAMIEAQEQIDRANSAFVNKPKGIAEGSPGACARAHRKILRYLATQVTGTPSSSTKPEVDQALKKIDAIQKSDARATGRTGGRTWELETFQLERSLRTRASLIKHLKNQVKKHKGLGIGPLRDLAIQMKVELRIAAISLQNSNTMVGGIPEKKIGRGTIAAIPARINPLFKPNTIVYANAINNLKAVQKTLDKKTKAFAKSSGAAGIESLESQLRKWQADENQNFNRPPTLAFSPNLRGKISINLLELKIKMTPNPSTLAGPIPQFSDKLNVEKTQQLMKDCRKVKAVKIDGNWSSNDNKKLKSTAKTLGITDKVKVKKFGKNKIKIFPEELVEAMEICVRNRKEKALKKAVTGKPDIAADPGISAGAKVAIGVAALAGLGFIFVRLKK